MRSELSDKNEFKLDKHRYLELKHYCLQYKDWRHAAANACRNIPTHDYIRECKNPSVEMRPVECAAIAADYFIDKCDQIEKCCALAGGYLAEYLLEGVTENRTYDYLKTMREIPCGREYYYKAYRKFFWILDATRK